MEPFPNYSPRPPQLHPHRHHHPPNCITFTGRFPASYSPIAFSLSISSLAASKLNASNSTRGRLPDDSEGVLLAPDAPMMLPAAEAEERAVDLESNARAPLNLTTVTRRRKTSHVQEVDVCEGAW